MKILHCCYCVAFFNLIKATEELINLQDFNFNDTVFEVGVKQQSSCHYVLAKTWNENEGTTTFSVNTTDSRVFIPTSVLFNNNNNTRVFLELSARLMDGSLCLNSVSHRILYNFPSPHITSKYIILLGVPATQWHPIYKLPKRGNYSALLHNNVLCSYLLHHLALSLGGLLAAAIACLVLFTISQQIHCKNTSVTYTPFALYTHQMEKRCVMYAANLVCRSHLCFYSVRSYTISLHACGESSS